MSDPQAVADKRDIVVQAAAEDVQILSDKILKCECGNEITISAGEILVEQIGVQGSVKKEINCPKCNRTVQR